MEIVLYRYLASDHGGIATGDQHTVTVTGPVRTETCGDMVRPTTAPPVLGCFRDCGCGGGEWRDVDGHVYYHIAGGLVIGRAPSGLEVSIAQDDALEETRRQSVLAALERQQEDRMKIDIVKKPLVVSAEPVMELTDVNAWEGIEPARPGDWIITGVRGEPYPINDGVLRETYTLANGDPIPPHPLSG